MTKGTKRTYTKEFKKEAVRLYEATEKSQAEIERELGITEGLLSKWIKRLREEGEQAFPGKGKLTDRDDEIERLKAEIRILKQERDILKKTVGIFSNPKR
jgi:transposase